RRIQTVVIQLSILSAQPDTVSSLAGRIAVTGGTAIVENDLPLAVGSTPPNRIEGSNAFAGRISNRTAGHRQRARIEDLDSFGFPGERRLWAFEEALPAGGDLAPAAVHTAVRKEDCLGGKKGGEPRRVPIRQVFGERDFGLADLLLQLCVRLGVQAPGQ